MAMVKIVTLVRRYADVLRRVVAAACDLTLVMNDLVPTHFSSQLCFLHHARLSLDRSGMRCAP